MKRSFRRNAIAAVVLSAIFGGAQAATFTVDTLLDTPDANPGDGIAEDASGNTSFRAAVEESEASAGADSIVFDAGLIAGGDITIELNDANVDGGTDADERGPTAFKIEDTLTVTGPSGDNGVTIARPDAADAFRLFHVTSTGDLTLTNMHLRGGLAQGGAGAGLGGGGGGGGAAGLGGAILNEGGLGLSHSTLSNHQAVGGTGARSGTGSNSGGGGGGLAEMGSGQSGGGPNANMPGAIGGGGNGGNESSGAGAGSAQNGTNGGEFGGGGGGGYRLSTGGSPPNPIANGGDGGDGGFGGGGAGGGAAFSFNGTTNPGVGGTGGFGAGSGTNGQAADQGDGGDGGGGAGLGGAIFNDGGSVDIENSTISGNTALGGSSSQIDYGDPVLPATGNGGAGSGHGAAVFSRNGSVTIRNSTIADNTNTAGSTSGGTAGSAGGSVFNLGDGAASTMTIDSSIVADTAGGNDIVNDTINGGTATTPNNNGQNLVESNSGFTGGVVSTADPQLAPLADNRGPTPTHAIPATSPAIDSGSAAAAAEAPALTTDQRRGIFSRTADGDLDGSSVIDIGAFELTQIDYGDAPDFVSGKGPTTLLNEQGSDDFRISTMGNDGEVDPNVRDNFAGRESNVAYNATGNEYFVVWHGDGDTGTLVDNEFEIFGQRINADTGALIGGRIRVSTMGPDGNANFRAQDASVAWNSTDNTYLVVWEADDDTAPLVDNENEIFGRRINAADGTAIGAQFRISTMGPDGDTSFRALDPQVAYNATDNQFLVTWHGDDDTAPLVDNEQEVFGRRFNAATGAAIGGQFRISVMGDDSEATATVRDDFRANDSRVAWNSTDNTYMVVWVGDDGQGGLIDNENEVWNRIVNANGTLGAQTRTSNIGVDGDTTFGPATFNQPPGIAYSPVDNQFLVTWTSDQPPTDGEFETFGRRVSAAGSPVAAAFQISQAGPPGNTDFDASDSVATYDADSNSFLVAWHGDDAVDNKFDVYARRVTFDASPATTVVINDSQDVRISHMGSADNNDPNFDAQNPAAASDGSGGFFVIWDGDDDTAPLVDSETEVFGQLASNLAVVDYETLGRDDGPAHRLTQGLFIGTAVDQESDGQPNLTATGDDANGATPDDEDGIPSPVTFGSNPSFMIPVTNTTGSPATLYGWIDYNADGMFDNATERTSVAVPDGTMPATPVNLDFGATPGGTVNNTFLRLRLGTQPGAANPTGLVDDGEVEDYAAEFTIDVTPDPFNFIAQPDVPRNSLRTSNTITVSSIDVPVSISITNGEYSINGGSYTSAAGMVSNNDTVTVRHTSAGTFSTPTTTTLDINGVSDDFVSTTVAEDTTPDAFNFTAQNDVPRSSLRTSNAITVSGINSMSAITVTNGEYSINGGVFTSAPGNAVDGDTVEVRHTSSPNFSTMTTTTLDIGGVTADFVSTTLAEDTTPDAFNFVDQTDVPLSSLRTSNNIIVSGINSVSPISIVNGEYSIDGGAFTSAAGNVVDGNMVTVRHTSSPNFATMTTTTLDIGGVTDDFVSTTLAEDTTPDAFNFVAQTDVPLNSLRTSNAITVSGINSMASVSITNGEYSVNGGAFTSAAGNVVNGNLVTVRHTSAATFSTDTDTTLNIGGASDVFRSTTLAEDTAPLQFNFVDQIDVPINSLRTSNAITVSDINSDAPISVVNGEYAVNGGAYTSAAGTVADGDTVTVRHTSSASFSTDTDTTLDIGGVSDVFTSTTLEEDTAPDPFMFTDVTGVDPNTVQTSNQISVNGINAAASVSIAGGTYSINGGPFTSAAGTVSDGDMVRVQHTSSASFEADVDTTLTIDVESDTFTSTTRDDGDGVPTAVEDAGPNGGDGNNDSILDSQQENVATLPTATGRGDMTLVVSSACAIFNNVMAVDVGTIPQAPPPGEDFAFGLVSFELPCETATVDITYHGAGGFAGVSYFKYGPTTPGDGATTTWYPFNSFATVNGNTWTLDLEDNRLGDDTGDDGVIVEPGGPSVSAVLGIPTVTGWVAAMLAGLIALFGFAGLRRQG